MLEVANQLTQTISEMAEGVKIQQQMNKDTISTEMKDLNLKPTVWRLNKTSKQ